MTTQKVFSPLSQYVKCAWSMRSLDHSSLQKISSRFWLIDVNASALTTTEKETYVKGVHFKLITKSALSSIECFHVWGALDLAIDQRLRSPVISYFLHTTLVTVHNLIFDLDY